MGREPRQGQRWVAREGPTRGRRAGDGTCRHLWCRRCQRRCHCWSLPGCCLSSEKALETDGDNDEAAAAEGAHKSQQCQIHVVFEKKRLLGKHDGLFTCELTAAAAEFSKASTASSQPKKPLTGPLSRSPRSGTPPRAPSSVAGPVTSPPNCCCSAASQIRSSREAGVGP